MRFSSLTYPLTLLLALAGNAAAGPQGSDYSGGGGGGGG